jgi:tetratricopeptide (TPR) repeat protein
VPLADYELDAPIGSGGAATVYRARDKRTGERVAVKLAHRRSDEGGRFEREAAVLSVIASEHVVRVIAAGRDDGRPYVVMELLDGHDLEVRLRHGKRVAARDVVGWLRQAARALDLAHGVGLVHRDLKPSNLFLETRGRLKVLDFGLVKRMDEVRAVDDAMLGTPQFMAPEQVRGQGGRIGPATDVWAVGMLAVRLLTGEPYWTGKTVLDVLGQIDAEPMIAPSTRWPWLPPAFDEWFARACDRTAALRFASVGGQIVALSRAMAGATGELVPSGAPEGPAFASSHLTQFVPRGGGIRLVGRVTEARQLARRLIARPGLVTLVGPAGIGKTALAEHVVASIAAQFPGGTFRVAPDDDAIAEEIAAALAGTDRDRLPTLLWIDGAPPSARPVLLELLARSPTVTFLVTARVPLEIAGEQRELLGPLDLPDDTVAPEEAGRYAALVLFTQRAGEVVPGFVLRPEQVADAARLVRALGGIPLAIELAAGQLATLPLSAIAARVAGGGIDGLAGSLELLSPEQRRVLQALSLAAGGATAVEVRALTGVAPEAPLLALAACGLVRGLPEEPVRWTVLPPIRELALRALGDDLAVRRRFVELLAAAPPHQRIDDAIAALGWALTSAPDLAPALAAGLVDPWVRRGQYHEGLRWLRRVLARSSTPAVLLGAARLALLACRHDEAEAWARQARGADERLTAGADQLLGSIARERGEYGRALARHEAARRRFERLGDAREVARSQSYASFAAWLSGDVVQAGRFADAIDLGVVEEDDEAWAWLALNRGAIALYEGRITAAEEELAAALDASSRAGFAEGIAWSLDLRGSLALITGDALAAEARLRASLRVHHRLGDRWRTASVLEGLALLGDGARRFAAAEAIRTSLGLPVPACERARVAGLARVRNGETVEVEAVIADAIRG